MEWYLYTCVSGTVESLVQRVKLKVLLKKTTKTFNITVLPCGVVLVYVCV